MSKLQKKFHQALNVQKGRISIPPKIRLGQRLCLRERVQVLQWIILQFTLQLIAFVYLLNQQKAVTFSPHISAMRISRMPWLPDVSTFFEVNKNFITNENYEVFSIEVSAREKTRKEQGWATSRSYCVSKNFIRRLGSSWAVMFHEVAISLCNS